MSTKKESTQVQTTQFDSGSKNVFDSLQKPIGENLTNDMQLDPTKSKTFNLGLQNALQGNAQLKNRAAQNFAGNMRASGFGEGNNAFQQAQMGRMGRAAGAMDSQAVNQNYMNYDMMRRQATQLSMGYHPLQTGQTTNTTEKTSGLGTWLPQVIGAGAQIGLGFATAGMSTAASAASKGASAGMGMAGTAASGMSNYFNSGNNFSANNGNFFGSSNGNMFNPNVYSGLNGGR